MKKLFVVCPFSSLEGFLRQQFGPDILFYTSMAGVIRFDNYKHIIAVRDIMEREEIRRIYLVTDISCRFLNAIISRQPQQRSYAVEALENIYVDHFYESFMNQPVRRQQKRLAALNVIQQAQELLQTSLLDSFIEANQIRIQPLVTDRQFSVLQEVQLEDLLQY